MTLPDDLTSRTWIQLMRSHGAAMTRIETALAAQDLPPLSWYDILWELERAGPDGLRQYELEPALLLRQYSVSRLVERMQKQGLLLRKRAAGDGRGKRLTLTPEGAALRRRMWQVYGPLLQEMIGTRLNAEQRQQLCNLLTLLVQADAPAGEAR
jgi:DNA-binding MarR family transcriptional regulator